MNTKLLAIVMAAVMVMSAVVIGISNPSTGEDSNEKRIGADPANPVWIIGSKNGYYLVEKEKTIVVPPMNGAAASKVYPEININDSAFDSPTVEISVAKVASFPDADEELTYTTIYKDVYGKTPEKTQYTNEEGLLTIDIDLTAAPADGKYPVKVTTIAAANPETAYYYIFDVSVTRTGGGLNDSPFEDKEQHIFYAAYIKVTDSPILPDEPGTENGRHIVLSGVDDAATDAVEKRNTFVGVDEDTIIITQDAVVDNYVFMQLTDNEYNWTDYDFYAAGLPLGIAMKIDGEISGKVASSVSTNTEPKDFTVYAVDKSTGHGVYSATFKYKVLPADNSFNYTLPEVDPETGDVVDVTYAWNHPGYMVVKNDEEFGTTVTNADGSEVTAADGIKVYLTLDDNKVQDVESIDGATFEAGVLKVDETVLNDYTGIVQVQIVKGDYVAVIHVLVVGPVVHSGLMPTVTAN